MDEIVALLDMSGDCLADEAPPCSCACPLGIDVRGFIKKVKTGSASAAYKLYSNSAVLPGVVCHICDEPCKNACVLADNGDSVSLRELEKYCWRESGNKASDKFYVPEKNKRVLIIGAGPTGISCAVKLARRGYAVELVEKSGRTGGSLWLIDEGTLPKRVLGEELDKLSGLKFLDIRLNTEVRDLRDYCFDAALVATGSGGSDLQASGMDGVFFAGSLLWLGQNSIRSIKKGSEMSYILENYIKVGRMDTLAEPGTACKYRPDAHSVEASARIEPQGPNGFSGDEAKSEASRCLLCSCSKCMDACDMLTFYRKSAKRLLLDASDTINKTQNNKKTALRQIMACTQCGLCRETCPADIDLKSLCAESRRVLHKNGRLPDALYDYWINDMAFANGSEAALFIPPAGNKNPRYLFFPGCQMGASDPGYVTESYRWLLSTFAGDVAFMLHCCGAPAYWAGDDELLDKVKSEIKKRWDELNGPTFVLPCPTCREMFQKHLPEINTVSLWELMAEHFRYAGRKHASVSIFDPCSSKYDEKAQRSIRLLVERLGYEISELPAGGKDSRCCGYGGLIYTTSPELVSQIAEKNASLGGLEFITYCTNCRESFALEGKPSRHILDLLFFEGEERNMRKPPDLTTRRTNRTALKRTLMMEAMGMEYTDRREHYRDLELDVSLELREKMNRGLIHDDNIKMVIYSAENGGKRILDMESGSYTAHMSQGKLTFWVQYAKAEGGAYVLRNVYAHRMNIEEDGPEA